MINDILQQLKSVPGVSGVLVLDKNKNNTYQLLPASFSQTAIKNLGLRLLELTGEWMESEKIEMKFDNGLAWLINTEKIAVLILARPEISIPDLNLFLKNSLLTIEKKLYKGTADFFTREYIASSSFRKQLDYQILVRAVNQVASSYQGILGSFLVTKNLRRAKEKSLPNYPFLNNFFVDGYGTVSLLPGVFESSEHQIIQGVAAWIWEFKVLCDSSNQELKETSLRELTSPLKMELENCGFYNILEKLIKYYYS